MRVVHLDAALFHHFLELTVADRIRHIPTDDVASEVTAPEIDHHMLAAATRAMFTLS
jgi:hypothetical protein